MHFTVMDPTQINNENNFKLLSTFVFYPVSLEGSTCVAVVWLGVGLTECQDAILQAVTQIRALRAAVGGGYKWG